MASKKKKGGRTTPKGNPCAPTRKEWQRISDCALGRHSTHPRFTCWPAKARKAYLAALLERFPELA